MLNQKTPAYRNWIQARDVFRQLRESDQLSAEQRQLAAVFEEYNQNRINWHERYGLLQEQYGDLQEQLDSAQADKALLEQKIQAITDLEAAISTRKEP